MSHRRDEDEPVNGAVDGIRFSLQDADADSRDPSSDSPLLGSPISPSHRAQDSCDSTLQLTDVVLPLEHSSFDKVTSAGSFCYNESFALPHGPVRSSEALDDIIEPAPGCVAWEERHATASVGGCSFIGVSLYWRDGLGTTELL